MVKEHQKIEAQCHCGNIRFTFERSAGPGERIAVRACGCSFCMMHGGVYTSDPNGRLDVYIEDSSAVHLYRFGTATADFHVCRQCGVVPLVSSEIEGNLYAVVNVNTFQNMSASDFDRTESDFDGETTESRLARRSRTWIPSVTITSASD